MEEGDVRREGCERRMTKLFELGVVLKGLHITYYPYYREEEKIIAISKTVNVMIQHRSQL